MRASLVASLLMTAALAAGCGSSKEEQVDFVPMPKDMAVDIWHVKDAPKPATGTQAAPAPSTTPSQ
jgi:hypothetical protein